MGVVHLRVIPRSLGREYRKVRASTGYIKERVTAVGTGAPSQWIPSEEMCGMFLPMRTQLEYFKRKKEEKCIFTNVMFKVMQEMIELILNPCSSDSEMSFHHSSLPCLCHSGPATFTSVPQSSNVTSFSDLSLFFHANIY